MSKNLILLLLTMALVACKDEPSTETDQTTASPAKEAQTSSDKMAELKKNAFDEGDTFGRVNHSLGQIQKQFVLSNNLRPQDGKQSIFVDERFTIIVRKEKGDEVIDAKVNLKNLDQRNGGMRLLPDTQADEWPGFSVSVIEGKPGVEIIKNGEKVREERELKIFMADRSLIEQAVPAFIQALNIVHDRI